MKLSPEEAQRFGVYLTDLAATPEQAFEFAQSPKVQKFLRRTKILPTWSWAYEFSTIQLGMFTASLFGADQILLQTSRKGYSVLLDDLEGSNADEFQPPKVKFRYVVIAIACLCALSRTIRAIGLHSLSMDELIHKGLAGDNKSLCRAVAIDPTVLSSPRVASYVSRLHINRNTCLLEKISLAAANGPNKQLFPNWKLRYFERIMREGKAFETYRREEIYVLIVDKLRLYGTKGDSFKGLHTLFERWRKEATT